MEIGLDDNDRNFKKNNMRIGVKIMLILSKYSKNYMPNLFLKIQEYMILFCTLKYITIEGIGSNVEHTKQI